MAQAKADAYGYQASAEAREMHEKGYTYQQETQRKVATAAMENAGHASMPGGIAADMMQFGIGVNMAKQAVELTQSAIQGSPEPAKSEPAIQPADTWDCACGQKGNRLPFCPQCGGKRPSAANTWDCACGQKGNTMQFCPQCGARRPSVQKTWDCSCGRTGNTTPFCPSCGNKRP